ncbi:MAG: NADase-type glycan-binding domain-containing protein [Jatrophihabitans sp.]
MLPPPVNLEPAASAGTSPATYPARPPAMAAALVAPITLPPVANPPGAVIDPAITTDGAAAAQLPQRAHRAPARKVKPVENRTRQVGDLICGDCGTGNGASRKFCRQCGASLATAEQVQARWWRKVLPHRRKRVMAAGTRPGRSGSRKGRRRTIKAVYYKLRTVGAVLVLIVGAFFAAYPPARNLLLDKVGHAKSEAGKALSGGLTEVHPTKVTGAAANPPIAAGKAFDGNRATYWLAPFDTNKPPVLTVTFSSKQVLRQIVLTSGDEGNYVAHGRPRVVRLDFSNGKSTLLRLKDQPTPQTLSITGGVGVQTVSIRIEDVYQATQKKSSDVAIGELEFFALL